MTDTTTVLDFSEPDLVCAKVAVIGSGSWGTAICGLLAPHAGQVVLWARSPSVAEAINETHHNPRHLSHYEFPANVRATSSMAEAFDGADAAVFAVPSAFLRGTCEKAAPYVAPELPLLVLTKGIERGSGLLMSDVVASCVGNPARVAALSGPNHAEEICMGMISAAVIAAPAVELAEYFQALVVAPDFRAYASADLVGVEVCGAVKNVIAIAAGITVGLGAGDNALAALMTRGLAEIGRVLASLGGDPLTCMGLAGMGDLVATCTSPHSRNRSFGEAFVAGEDLAAYEARTGMVVEGAEAVRSVVELANARGIEVPIARAVHSIIYEGATMADAVWSLLGRTPHEEFYGMQ